jgi:hypothetical protein
MGGNIFFRITEPFFSVQGTPRLRRTAVTILFLVLLYLTGFAHWVFFFNAGRINFSTNDWPKEFMYYSVLREALQQHTIPYHVTQKFQDTDRFLAIPETNLSPQILLLPHMSTAMFILCNIILLYSLGFWGCLLLRRKYRLSLFSFCLLFLLFNFNGHITSHLAVGHSMWGGYFLLPFFFLFLLELAENHDRSRAPFKVALVLFALSLQGAFHFFVWCGLFLLLFALFNRQYAKRSLSAAALAMVLSSVRLLPAAVAFIGKKQAFVTGYPSITVLLQSFVVLRDYTYKKAGIVHGPSMWWEYDLYTGVVGFLLLLYFGVYLYFSKREELRDRRFEPFALPLAALSLLSVGNLHAFVTSMPVPLLSAERVSTRFIILPFVLLLIFACVRLDKQLPRLMATVTGRMLSATAALAVALMLARHSWTWRVGAIERYFGESPSIMPVVITIRPDALYIDSVGVATIISLCAIMFTAWYLRKGAGGERLTTDEEI